MKDDVQRTVRQRRWNAQQPVAIILLGCLLVLVVACGATAEGAPSSTAKSSTQLQQCGSVRTNPRGLPLNAAAAQQAETCFWQDYQKCQSATLGFNSASIDTVAVHTFSLRNSGQHCTVTDAVQHAIVPAKLSAVKTYTCSTVAMKPDGLHFSGCGNEDDVVVP